MSTNAKMKRLTCTVIDVDERKREKGCGRIVTPPAIERCRRTAKNTATTAILLCPPTLPSVDIEVAEDGRTTKIDEVYRTDLMKVHYTGSLQPSQCVSTCWASHALIGARRVSRTH